MEDIKTLLENLAAEMSQIRSKVNKLDGLEKRQDNLLTEVRESRRENKELRNENEKLKERVNILENTVDKLERKEKKKNIVIKGLDIQDNESGEETVSALFREKMKIDVEVEHIKVITTQRIGKIAVTTLKNKYK